MWKVKGAKKQVRKPVSSNFAPKRLAINFQPPTIILEYLAIDTGKLYHHKMRLDSVLRKPNINRMEILNYLKTKHHLYFVHEKIKDEQTLKFIDRILIRMGKAKPVNKLEKIEEQTQKEHSSASPAQSKFMPPEDDDFDYLNDDEEYEEDYEDYEEEPKPQQNKQNEKQKLQASNNHNDEISKKEGSSSKDSSSKPFNTNKNTFMTYCQEEYDEENEQGEENQAEWDLDMDADADFDFV